MITRILSWLYLSDDQFTPDGLEQHNITAVMNVGGSVTRAPEMGVHCHHHLIDGYNTINEYDSIIKTIDSYRKQGLNILVHCRAGISRSPLMVALMMTYLIGMSIDDAITFVEHKRPQTQINQKMLRGLKLDMKKETKK